MNYNIDFIVDAKKLINRPIQTKQIKEYVITILQSLFEEIAQAYKEGKSFIITDIPIMFDIPNMKNKNSQRVVLSEIIKSLKIKNYRVYVDLNKDYCRLKITWLSEEDENNIKNQTELIKKHIKKF